MKFTITLMLFFLLFVTTLNCVSQKKVAYDTIPKDTQKIYKANFKKINELVIENKKKSLLLIKLNNRINIVERDFRKIQEKPVLLEILKLLLYSLTVLSAFLLGSFGLSEEIKEIYGDESTKNGKKYNSTNTKNFYYTLIGLFFTIMLTIVQFSYDTDRGWLVCIYGIILFMIALLFIKIHNTTLKQSYLKKIIIMQKNITRWFYRIINRKNYCEVCLKNCNKKETWVGYFKNNKKNRIKFVRFGHNKCIEIHFKEYNNLLPSIGAYVLNAKVIIPFNDLEPEIDKIKEFQKSSTKKKHELNIDIKVLEKLRLWINLY